MALLTRDEILKRDDLKSEIVEVPEWGGEVRVCTMSGTARDRFEASITGSNGVMDMKNVRAKLAACTIVGDDGNLLFNEKDIIELGNKSCAALDRIFAAAQRLNLITNSDVEALAKN